jgi:hypothetical protein
VIIVSLIAIASEIVTVLLTKYVLLQRVFQKILVLLKQQKDNNQEFQEQGNKHSDDKNFTLTDVVMAVG